MCVLPLPVTEAVYGLESSNSLIRTFEFWSEFYHTGSMSRYTMLYEVYLQNSIQLCQILALRHLDLQILIIFVILIQYAPTSRFGRPGMRPSIFLKLLEMIRMWSHGRESLIWAIVDMTFKNTSYGSSPIAWSHPPFMSIGVRPVHFHWINPMPFLIWYHIFRFQYFFFLIYQNSCKLLSQALFFLIFQVSYWNLTLSDLTSSAYLSSHEFAKWLMLWF